MSNIFAIATRKKLRFPVNGSITVEDLWDLPLKSVRANQADLNGLASMLYDAVEQLPRKNFVDDEDEVASTDKDNVRLKLEVVLAIIDVKKEERKAKETATLRAGQAAQLDDLIQRKQNAELENLSLEELKARRAAING